MSIILTAGKKAVAAKPKSSKPKKKKEPEVNTTPPMSSSRTVVWYWMLEGEPTTVMYTKDRNEVWCNGDTLDTPQGNYPSSHIDFTIMSRSSPHHARIIAMSTGEGHMSHQLFVDGCMILEHLGQSPEESPTQITMEMGADAYSVSAAPPPYEAIIPIQQKKTQ